MKPLHLLLATALAALAVFCLGGMLLPDRVTLERSITIHQPPAAVFALLEDTTRFASWSPWIEVAPGVRNELEPGEDDAAPALVWRDVDGAVLARARIVERVDAERIVAELALSPSRRWRVAVDLRAVGQGTEAVAQLRADHGGDLVSRWLALLVGVRHAHDLDRALLRLRHQAERAGQPPLERHVREPGLPFEGAAPARASLDRDRTRSARAGAVVGWSSCADAPGNDPLATDTGPSRAGRGSASGARAPHPRAPA